MKQFNFNDKVLADCHLTSIVIDRDKVLYISSFDLQKMNTRKTIKQIATFFQTKDQIVHKIMDIQVHQKKIEKEFPELFFGDEDNLATNKEWEKLKNTDLYKKLMKNE